MLSPGSGLQGEAIAVNLREMFGFDVPIISVVIGEGGSGGALAIGCANYSFIMENAVYYVASPEACAAILWKSREQVAAVSNIALLFSCPQEKSCLKFFFHKISGSSAPAHRRRQFHHESNFNFFKFRSVPTCLSV